MNEDIPGQDAPTQDPAPDAPDMPAKKTDLATLPPDVIDYIGELRSEAKKHRLEKEAAEQAKKQEAEQRLADQNEWKQLAENRATELAEMSEYKTRWDAMTERVSEQNARRIDMLSEDDRKLVPEYDNPLQLQEWLNAAEERLKRPAPPPTDAGERGDKARPTVKLTEAELSMAKMMGLTPEQYASAKNLKGIEWPPKPE